MIKLNKIGNLKNFDTKAINEFMIPITYTKLKTLRDNGLLIPGMQYRITDYTGEIFETDDVISARHQFDIIVFADDVNVLNENARAIQHEGDTYFEGQNLEKWELKYNIDNIGNYGKLGGKQVVFQVPEMGTTLKGVLTENDTTYEGLPYKIGGVVVQGINGVAYISDLSDNYSGVLDAGAAGVMDLTTIGGFSNIQIGEELSSGHGVITWMKDNNENSMFYDFKNVKHARYRITSYLGEEPENDMYGLPNANYDEEESPIVFDWDDKVFMFTFDDHGNDGSLSAMAQENQFGIGSLNCVFYNTTDKPYYCVANKLGNSCFDNTLGNDCDSNTFGNNFRFNSFGNSCYSNSFGNDCDSNSFGDNFRYNSFGNDCDSNTFGNDVQDCRIVSSNYSNKDYIYHCKFENGVAHVKLSASFSTSSNYSLRNIVLHSGLRYNNNTIITLDSSVVANANYDWHIGRDKSGSIKQWCPANLV